MQKLIEQGKKYQIIYADPPWSYKSKGKKSADAHYQTMDAKDIYALPVKEIASDNAILFLWVTYPMLQEGLNTIKEWGFEYKTIGFQWIKKNKKSDTFFFGMGRWTRANSECCLIATKGSIKRVNNAISQLIIEPIEYHSKKPDIVREKIIQLVGDLPRIELFARQKTDGWEVCGNEV